MYYLMFLQFLLLSILTAIHIVYHVSIIVHEIYVMLCVVHCIIMLVRIINIIIFIIIIIDTFTLSQLHTRTLFYMAALFYM